HADPAGEFFGPADVGDFGLDDLDVVAVGVDAVAAGAEDLAEHAPVLRLADFAVDEELAIGQGVAEFAGDDADLAWLDERVGDDGAFIPDRGVEVTAGSAQIFPNADLVFVGPVAGLSGLAGAE